MFTVKNVTPDGYENIFSARTVEFRPAIPDGDVKGRDAEVWIDEGTDSQRVFSLGSGNVYVMNERGSTVATYHLKCPRPQAHALAEAVSH